MQWGLISATAADVNTACCSHLSNKPNAFQEKNKTATAHLTLLLLLLTLLSFLRQQQAQQPPKATSSNCKRMCEPGHPTHKLKTFHGSDALGAQP
jgi:hypothetical protein